MTPEQKIELIRDRAARLYGVRPEALMGRRRTKPVTRARHMTAALAFDLIPEWTLQQVAFAVGMTAHGSASYGIRCVAADEKQKELFDQLRAALIEDTGDPADWKPLDRAAN
jgi:chromosomal replication initiation ATPase DnaA